MLSKRLIKTALAIVCNPIKYLGVRNLINNLNQRHEKIVFILTCGPSLELVAKSPGLAKLLSENFVISIKQAFNEFRNETDIHIVNDIRYTTYDYNEARPLVMSVGKILPEMVYDFNFPIADYSYETSVFVTNRYAEASLNRMPYLRPWGIGVMYELGLFLPEILNCEKLVIIGFDMNKDGKYHYYDNSEDENFEKYSVDAQEFDYNKTTIPELERWYKGLDIKVALYSPLSDLPFKNKINNISELRAFLEA